MSSQAIPASNIVIIEDNKADILLLRKALMAHGVTHEAKIISDGDEAVAYLNDGAFCTGSPDLIILDLNLPKRDGIEILTAIRACASLDGSPVAILTTSDSPSEKKKAESIGVQAFLRKPVDLSGFLALGAIFKEMLSS